jgi:hypothetical protein
MKKGRHRRFEEARKLKQAGPAAFGGFTPKESDRPTDSEDDEYAAIAERYGAFDDDDEDDEETAD